MATQQTSLAHQKVRAYLKMIQDNEEFWNSMLVFLGTLFLFNTFTFYPNPLNIILAIICGAVAYKVPWAGTGLGMVLAFPAVAYQSAPLAWLFTLLISLTFFQMFTQWAIISALQILILSPFAFHGTPFGSFFGWFTIFGMLIAAFHFGSKKSLGIASASVFLILLFSSIWLMENSAYLPVNIALYQPASQDLMISKGPTEIVQIIPTGLSSLAGLATWEAVSELDNAMGKTFSNVWLVLFSDTGIIQILGWAVVLYLVSSLSGTMRNRRSQSIASLAYLLIIPIYYFIATLTSTEFHMEFVGMVASSVILIAILEQFEVKISKEEEINRTEKMKKFGKFGLQDMGLGSSEVSMKDVGGYDDVKDELKESIVVPLEKKELAYTYGMKAPSGILLFGPPGTGKTMLMRALAKELKYGFYYVKASDIMSQWHGESERNVSEVFEIARKNAPSILFFDEIDSIGKKRSLQNDDVAQRVLSILLQQIDGGIKSKKPVILIGATNVPDQIDEALLRPGRLDKIIYMSLPDKKTREAIFRVHLKNLPIEDKIDYKKFAEKTERFSGADIKNIINEAVKLAAKEAMKKGVVVPLKTEHVIDIISKVKPSTSIASLDNFKQFRTDFERRIGAKETEKKEIVKWEEVIGLDRVKQAFLETIEFPLLHEEEMKKMKIKPAKGILLFGPPGTGKTLIVKAASGELKASFQVLTGAEIVKRGYSQAVSIIKETFNRARENTPAIIFVDEIESIAPSRGTMASEVTGQFLTEMDGINELKGVVVVGTTNRPGALDTAILRPGRFDKIFYIPPPNERGRAEMFKLYLGDISDGLDLKKLGKMTLGFTGADIYSICQQVKMDILRQKIAGKKVKMTTDNIAAIIKTRRPSLTEDMLKEYSAFLKEYGERK
ncbi:MAG: AAA family ATPase [Candidatus Micrarchaeota archaeon]